MVGGDIQMYESGRMSGILRGHVVRVTKFAFSSRGLLHSGDSRGTIRAWQDGKCLAVLEGPAGREIHAMTFAPNGDLYTVYHRVRDMYTTVDRFSRMWVWRQHQCVAKLEGVGFQKQLETEHRMFGVETKQIVFAKDGTMYTLIAADGGSGWWNIVVWRDNRPLKVLQDLPQTPLFAPYYANMAIGVNDNLYVLVNRRPEDQNGGHNGTDVAIWRNEQNIGILPMCGGSPGDAVLYDPTFVTVGPSGVVYVLQESKFLRANVVILPPSPPSLQILMWKNEEFLGHLDLSGPLAERGIEPHALKAIAEGPDGTLYIEIILFWMIGGIARRIISILK
jgi:hypothetical protein